MEPDGILISIFRYFYKKRKAGPLEPKKPLVKWLPKYVVRVPLGTKVTSSSKPVDELESMLESFGFTFKYATKTQLYFTRGKSWGDFSISLIRIHLIFDTPLVENTLMTIEMADMCFVDTGDLWKLSTELSTYFSEQADLNTLPAS
ncbi:hypothetical protein DRW07_11010 [Alteromonas sediminis]|uniref:Uncharacterized protein n=1 Tax=Alteromonas sediminis TaxID=2259342 RepID=A0A3N5Z7E9_9ALTE|nr:hypothetical protein [Alteromonas sediminis]RPJ66604.1 hypothetical protein DRW07_11010 [Alteromonas sediminis]